MSLQEVLKMLCLQLGLTQADLAKKIGKAVVSVNRWENGRGFPSRSNALSILRIAENGNVSADCLSYLKDVLMPDTARAKSAAAYGFPDIDRDFLFQLADGSANSLYVIDAETYRLLYVNQKAERHALSVLAEIGIQSADRKLANQEDRRCFHYFANRNAPCPFCPLKSIGSDRYRDVMVTIPEGNRRIRVHAKSSELKGRRIYILYLTDITEEDAERGALYQLTNDLPGGAGIFDFYADGQIRLVFLNAALYRLIGEDRATALLHGDLQDFTLICPEDGALLRSELRACIAENRDADVDIRLKTEGDACRVIHVHAKKIGGRDERSTFYCTAGEAAQQA